MGNQFREPRPFAIFLDKDPCAFCGRGRAAGGALAAQRGVASTPPTEYNSAVGEEAMCLRTAFI
jgi:hypothetical protein